MPKPYPLAGVPAEIGDGTVMRWVDRRRAALGFALALSLGALAQSGGFEASRVSTGTRLLRLFLAADVHLADKRDGDGTILVAIYARRDVAVADQARMQLEATSAKIGELPARFVVVREVADLPAGVDAVFLAEDLAKDPLLALITAAEKERVPLFSPFEGDVEDGVTAGFVFTPSARVHLNRAAVARIGLELKPFFLRVVTFYGEPP